MAEPFLGEIRVFSFDFVPKGWAYCNGQLLPIQQNQALFSLLGAIYGGNGVNTFALPDFRGRTPIHARDRNELGQYGGAEACILLQQEIPNHSHLVRASDAPATLLAPYGAILGQAPSPHYSDSSPGNTLEATAAAHPHAISSAGASQGHENMQPYLTLNFCIALRGIYPSRP